MATEKKIKCLIVDDEPLILRSLSKALKARGHEVFVAATGAEGLTLWQKEKPQLVYLDVLIPDLSGPEVLAQIEDHDSAKVILMSAYAGEHNMETAVEMGADLFLSKPFEDLFEVIKMGEELVA